MAATRRENASGWGGNEVVEGNVARDGRGRQGGVPLPVARLVEVEVATF